MPCAAPTPAARPSVFITSQRRAEQPVAEQQADAGQDGERRAASRSALPANTAARHREALDELAEHEPWANVAIAGPVEERRPRSGVLGLRGSRNSNATPRKISAEQHHQDREVHRRDDDGESEREGREQPDAAEHQPGLVAVPDRRDRFIIRSRESSSRREREEDADAEIEAVEQHVHEHADAEDDGPDRHGSRSRVHGAAPGRGVGLRPDSGRAGRSPSFGVARSARLGRSAARRGGP